MFALQLQARQISKLRRRFIAWFPALIVCVLPSPTVLAQSKCQPPAPQANPANLFNEEQEMALGDVVAEQLESGFRISTTTRWLETCAASGNDCSRVLRRRTCDFSSS
jgi:hypothetical protein